MKHCLLAALISLLTMPALGDELEDTQRFINDLINKPSAPGMLGQAKDFGAQADIPLTGENQKWINRLNNQVKGAGQTKSTPLALYFVSFSIPEDGLKSLILAADNFGISSNIRGMVNNDMRDTANAVLRLVSEDKRGGVQINPKAFSTYGINAVPALVITCQGKYDRIAGNIAIHEALKKIAATGDCADTARTILAAHPEL